MMLYESAPHVGVASSSLVEANEFPRRLEVPAHRLLDVDGILYAEILGNLLRVGRTPSRITSALSLVIASDIILERSGALWIQCYHCRRRLLLEQIGLRFMKSGTIRNQPRCGSCRHIRGSRH